MRFPVAQAGQERVQLRQLGAQAEAVVLEQVR